MNEIINIQDLKKEFAEKTKVKDLKVFAESQQRLLERLMDENKQLQQKLDHVEQKLLSLDVAIKLQPEEIICLQQIGLLKKRSESRELSLDEVKRLDLLIKNLRLIREQSTQVIDTKDYTEVKEDELVAIARTAFSEKDR